jgi:tetratricopeptide (TPR) repeat protein
MGSEFRIVARYLTIAPMTKKSIQTTGADITRTALPEPARWKLVLGAVAIAMVALAVYHNSLQAPFVLDDDSSIKDNPTIRSLWQSWWPPTNSGVTVSGRPLLNFSLAVNYAISGREVWSYHVGNLLIHISAGLVLFGVVRRTLRQPILAERFGEPATALALAVALLWTVHPLQTESVTYIVQRAESLVGLFLLLTLWSFIRSVEPGAKREWQSLAFASCLAGMAAKEVMVVAPVLIALYDRIFVSGGWREVWLRRGRFHLSLFGTWLLLAVLVIAAGRRGGSAGLGTGSSFNYALAQVGAIGHYLRLAFWPEPLVFDYGESVNTSMAWVLPSAFVVVPLVGASLWAAWRGRPAGYCGLFFFGILAPTSSVVPVVTQTMAEHRMYLPVAAVISLAVLGLYQWLGRRSWLVFGVLIGAAMFGTYRRNFDYRSSQSIWEDTVAKWPNEARSRSNLGLILIASPALRAEGIKHLEKAIEISPRDPRPRNNLGLALGSMPGRNADAVVVFSKLVSMAPEFALGHANLGVVLHKEPGRQEEGLRHIKQALKISPELGPAHSAMGQVLLDYPDQNAAAIQYLSEAIRLNPDDADAHGNLGIALARDPARLVEAIDHMKKALQLMNFSAQVRNNLAAVLAKIPGQQQEAIRGYCSAILLQPDYWEAHYNLGMLLLDLPGRREQAVKHLEKAAKLAPDNASVRTNVGFALTDIPGRLGDAANEFAAVVQLQPEAADAHFNYGTSLLHLTGHEPEAMQQFQAVVRLKPDDAEAHNYLGLLLAEIPPRTDEAREHLRTALRLKPDFADAHYNLAKLLVADAAGQAEAIHHLEEALRLAPDHEPARELLGKLKGN